MRRTLLPDTPLPRASLRNQRTSYLHRLAKGVMFVTREQRNKVKYTIRNADTAARARW
ncbi:MAG TPA: hypothetical protein VF133_05085 [Terriglobales bacterium]